MNIYPLKFPYFLQKAAPSVIFTKTDQPYTVYLSFDDGPTPGVTDWVMDLLDEYAAAATFFCVGDKIRKHKNKFLEIVERGHRVANHSYFHLDGWHTPTKDYVADVERTEMLIKSLTHSKKLFRPPYGHISYMQFRALKKLGYKIVLWTNISGDFTPDLDIENTIWSISSKTRSGDILVFHDSKKAEKNLKAILPQILHNLKLKGFSFEKL